MTDHLQLLLRKAGYHLHTSAEKEVVRMISAFSVHVLCTNVYKLTFSMLRL